MSLKTEGSTNSLEAAVKRAFKLDFGIAATSVMLLIGDDGEDSEEGWNLTCPMG